MPIQRVALIFDDTVRPDTTGIYCKKALSALVQAEHFRAADLDKMPRKGFDLYLSIDDGLDYQLPEGLHPFAGWLIDTHMNFEWCLQRARHFDFVFTAQRDGAEAFRKRGLTNVQHLPLACDPDMHKKHDLPKEYELCFVGNMFPGPRLELVRLLQEHFVPMFIGREFFETMAQVYSKSRLVFNRSIKNDVNMRVFEAVACGSLLLTNDLRDNGQDQLFRDGIHLATYRDAEELLDKARFYLKEEKLREEIAARGREEALARHTYRHRMEKVLGTVEAGKTRVSVSAPGALDAGAPSLAAHAAAVGKDVLVVGSDAAEVDRLAAALASGRNVTAITPKSNAAQATVLSYPDASFDAAVIDGALEHLHDPLQFLRDVWKILRPDGSFLLRIQNARRGELVRGLMQGHWHSQLPPDRSRLYTLSDIEQLCFRAHLKPTEVGMNPGPGHDAWHKAGRPNALHAGELEIDGFAAGEAEEFYCDSFVLKGTPSPMVDFGMTSIVIPTFNQVEFTRRCCESIRRYTDEPYELIFVDNGSGDGTLEYLEGLRRAGGAGSQRSDVGDQRSEIRIIANRWNRGFPVAVNQGILAARGRQILLLNNDTVVTTGWLRHMLQAMYRDPAIGLVGPVSNNVSGPQQIPVNYDDLCFLEPFAWRWARSQGNTSVDTSRLVGFCLLIRRALIDKIGLVDEQFGIGCYEDDDYTRRAIEAGFRAVIARNSFVHHFGGMTFRNSNIDFGALMAENRRKFEAKWGRREESGDQKSEVRSQRSEVGEQRSEVGGQKSEVGQAEPVADVCHVAPIPVEAEPAAAPSSCLPVSLSPALPVSPPPLLALALPLLGSRRRKDGVILLTCCMIVRNNAKFIAECIRSILPYVDQLIVLDTGSTDGTDQICRELGAEVHYFAWCDDFSAARNESLKYAKGKFIIWIDSDDVVPPESGEAIVKLLEGPIAPDVYAFSMKVVCPKAGALDLVGASEVDHVKIFLNHPAHRFEHRIHEQILGAIQRNHGRVEFTNIRIIHKNHDHSLEGQKRKFARDLKLLHLEEKERPTHPFTFFNLGMTYANRADRAGLGDKSDLERAKRYLHRSIDLAGPHDSTLPQAYSLLVSCHQRLGEERQARYWCDKALDKFPLDDELRFRKAMLYVAKGGPELEYAARLLEDIIARPGPERYNSGALGMGGYSTRNVLADVYFQMGQLKKAEQQWRLAIKEVPDYLPAWQGLADLVRQQQRWDKAEALARELIATVRFEVLGQFVLGDTMRALGRYEEAQRAYERILELQPGHPQALERLRSL